MEAVNLRLARAGMHGAVEITVRDILRLQFLAQQGEQRGELREDEQAMAIVGGFLQQFAKGFELGGDD